MHYVKGSRRMRGYWRRKPYTYDHPTKAQRRTHAVLARIAFEKGRNKFGTVEIIDGAGKVKEVPASAIPIIVEMRGLVIKPPLLKVIPIRISPLDRIRRLRKIIITQLGTELPVPE